ncbi:MATE family efflux transporter [Clostridium sp. LS]|uniref:MATE family efflux transporter n=1 Tax=Clostridium sp. LS TaxID=1352601 RepID=UPI001FA8FB2E|nr:MATE family efflux transporter [Clostridium sp. LS]
MDQILTFSVSIFATMMLSYAGEAAVSGVSLVDIINMLIVSVLAALTTGGAVIVSQYIGNKDKDKAGFAASQLFTISAVISIGITIFIAIFHRQLLHIVFGNIAEDVMAAAITYFVISGLSYPFLSIYDSGAALFRSIGNSKIPMTISIFMNIANLVGNGIGIFVFHAGVTGVAIATIISRAAAAVIIVYLSFNKKNQVFVSLSGIFSWSGEMIGRILNIAIPSGIENGLVQLGRVLLISITAMFGTAQIAANGIGNSLVMIPICFATSINLAIVTVIGQCVGAKDYSEAVRNTKKLIKLAYIGTIILSLGESLLLPWILNLYTLSEEVRHLTYVLVLIHNIYAIVVWPLSFSLPNALRAAGDVRFTMVISIGSMFVFRIFSAYVIGVIFHMGVIGVWIAMEIDWTFRAIVYITRFIRGKWKTFQVI